jgi:DNA (cytosine-5)-methyltransferase 1
MKLGGLFSGIGGFELAWNRLGHEVAWMCEIDKNARKVLAHRFPGVPIYEDIREVDAYQLADVDFVAGGSPCQGFSIAGKQTGFEHSESRLFSDYIRIIDALAQRGLRGALWENVPGVITMKDNDGERTFDHVAAALAGTNSPVRFGERRDWNSGVVAGNERAVAWRVLDSQHFGVAQRRRRVYAYVAFGPGATDIAGRIVLSDAGSVRGDFGTRLPQRNEARPYAGEGVVPSSGSIRTFRKGRRPMSKTDHETWPDDGYANTLNTFDYGDKRRTHLVVDEVGVRRLVADEWERLQSFPDGWSEAIGSDRQRCIAAGNAVTVNVAEWIMSRALRHYGADGCTECGNDCFYVHGFCTDCLELV